MASRTRTVVWTALSRDGLDEVLEYIAEDSPEAAEKVLAVVLGVAESLAISPSVVGLFRSYAIGRFVRSSSTATE